jgi:hypothetical protein
VSWIIGAWVVHTKYWRDIHITYVFQVSVLLVFFSIFEVNYDKFCFVSLFTDASKDQNQHRLPSISTTSSSHPKIRRNQTFIGRFHFSMAKQKARNIICAQISTFRFLEPGHVQATLIESRHYKNHIYVKRDILTNKISML